MLLRRSKQLPGRLMFPPGMEELKVQLETELQVQTQAPFRDTGATQGDGCGVHCGPSFLLDGREGCAGRNQVVVRNGTTCFPPE